MITYFLTQTSFHDYMYSNEKHAKMESDSGKIIDSNATRLYKSTEVVEPKTSFLKFDKHVD